MFVAASTADRPPGGVVEHCLTSFRPAGGRPQAYRQQKGDANTHVSIAFAVLHQLSRRPAADTTLLPNASAQQPAPRQTPDLQQPRDRLPYSQRAVNPCPDAK